MRCGTIALTGRNIYNSSVAALTKPAVSPRNNIEKGKKIIEEMHFDSDPEVKAFIGKVQTQRATVSSLTPHILEWLKDNNLTDKIRLRF